MEYIFGFILFAVLLIIALFIGHVNGYREGKGTGYSDGYEKAMRDNQEAYRKQDWMKGVKL